MRKHVLRCKHNVCYQYDQMSLIVAACQSVVVSCMLHWLGVGVNLLECTFKAVLRNVYVAL